SSPVGAGAGGGTKPAAGARHAASASVSVDASGSGVAVVQVAGAVRRPGVYRLRADRRVDDAVRRAGGPTRRADLAAVNLAAKVSDGQQVIVPVVGAAAGAASATGAVGTGTGGPASGGAMAATGPPLNLNAATP